MRSLFFYLSVCTVLRGHSRFLRRHNVKRYGNTSSIKLFVSSNPVFAQMKPRREASATHVFQLRNRFRMFSFVMYVNLSFRLYLSVYALVWHSSTLVTRSPSATICFHLPLNQSGYHPHLFEYSQVLL